MTTKQYLGQINRLDRMIQNKLAEIYQLKTMVCSVTVSSDKERVQTSSSKDKLGDMVSKIVDLENETDELTDSFIEKRNKIISQIDQIEDTDYYDVLSMRYVGKKTFEDIASTTHWSIRKVFMLHDKAILEFEKLYGHEYL
jgi:hypothetical protein